MRKRLLILLLAVAWSLPAPTFNLTSTQREILISWLFEPIGYLDISIRADGLSARQAWEQDINIDLTQWVRDNILLDAQVDCTPGDAFVVPCYQEMSMIWWMLANDQVNIPIPQRPVESEQWASVLHRWDETINAGLAYAGVNERNQKSQDTYNENSCPIGYTVNDPQTLCVVTGSVPSGAHLAQQQQVISQVLSVLE